jgi:hypothetical protein
MTLSMQYRRWPAPMQRHLYGTRSPPGLRGFELGGSCTVAARGVALLVCIRYCFHAVFIRGSALYQALLVIGKLDQDCISTEEVETLTCLRHSAAAWEALAPAIHVSAAATCGSRQAVGVPEHKHESSTHVLGKPGASIILTHMACLI